MIGRKAVPRDSAQDVAAARDVMPLLEWDAIDRLRQLPHVDLPGAEAHVYFDPEQDAVYKVIHIFKDGTVDAVSPGRISGLNDTGRAPTFYPSYPVQAHAENIIDYAMQQLDASLHDNIVLTELVGLTRDGRFLILKQPYLRGVTFGWSARRQSMGAQIGLRQIGANGSPTFVGMLSDGRLLLVVDGHERNLVYSAPDLEENEALDESTPAFLLDATARRLDPQEEEIIAPLLDQHNWGLSFRESDDAQ